MTSINDNPFCRGGKLAIFLRTKLAYRILMRPRTCTDNFTNIYWNKNESIICQTNSVECEKIYFSKNSNVFKWLEMCWILSGPRWPLLIVKLFIYFDNDMKLMRWLKNIYFSQNPDIVVDCYFWLRRAVIC